MLDAVPAYEPQQLHDVAASAQLHAGLGQPNLSHIGREELRDFAAELERALKPSGRVLIWDIGDGASAEVIERSCEQLSVPFPSEYVDFLRDVDGFTVDVYSASHVGKEYMPLYTFEVAGARRTVNLTRVLRRSLRYIATGAPAPSLEYIDTLIAVSASSLDSVVFSWEQLGSDSPRNIVVIDVEYMFEDGFSTCVSPSLDEHIARSLTAMISGDGNPVYW